MSQALELLQKVFTLSSFASVASDVQQMSVSAVHHDDEGTWQKMRDLLTAKFSFWSQLDEALFGKDTVSLLDVLEQQLFVPEDRFPNARANCAKLLGFLLQIFVQPFYAVSEKTKERRKRVQGQLAMQAGGSREEMEQDYEHENVRVPRKLYAKILGIYEEGKMKPEEMEIFVNLLGFLDDYEFSREKFEEVREKFEDDAALYRSGFSGRKPGEKGAATDAEGVEASAALEYAKKRASKNPLTAENETLTCGKYVRKQLLETIDIVSDSNDLAGLGSAGAVLVRDLGCQMGAMKSFGNAAFSAQEYGDAAQCYERALEGPLVSRAVTVLLDKLPVPEVSSEELVGALKDKGFVSEKEDDVLNSLDAAVKTQQNGGLKKDLAVLYSNLANAYLKTGRIGEAAESADCATRLEPGYAKGFFRLAEARHFLGEQEKALDAIMGAEKIVGEKDKALLALKEKVGV